MWQYRIKMAYQIFIEKVSSYHNKKKYSKVPEVYLPQCKRAPNVRDPILSLRKHLSQLHRCSDIAFCGKALTGVKPAHIYWSSQYVWIYAVRHLYSNAFCRRALTGVKPAHTYSYMSFQQSWTRMAPYSNIKSYHKNFQKRDSSCLTWRTSITNHFFSYSINYANVCAVLIEFYLEHHWYLRQTCKKE